MDNKLVSAVYECVVEIVTRRTYLQLVVGQFGQRVGVYFLQAGSKDDALTFLAEGAIMRSIILFSVLIYELVGPLLTKIALTKAGEISPKELNPPHSEPKRYRSKA